MGRQSLIDTLIKQHRNLQIELTKAAQANPSEAKMLLKQFKINFDQHLELENGTFYPEILKTMREKHMSTGGTQRFMVLMLEITKTVQDFLDKYPDANTINQNLAGFQKELESVIRVLNIRIESEEERVFASFLAIRGNV